MEADRIRSGDPDTYDGLVGIEAWVEAGECPGFCVGIDRRRIDVEHNHHQVG
jgi:hypothetical protein